MSTPTVTIAMGATMSISITVDPSGRFVYATIGTNPSTPTAVIAQFTIDQNTGALAAMTPPTVSAGGVGTAVITVEASGKYAYATSGESGWGSSSIAQFTIDQTTGVLTLMNHPTVQTSGIGPSGIVTVGK
jgi:6-phosphogluconolactonase (cycloisomerase 2 family)